MTLDQYFLYVQQAPAMKALLSGEQKVNDYLVSEQLGREHEMMKRTGMDPEQN